MNIVTIPPKLSRLGHVVLAQWHIAEGQATQAGQVLATLETTDSVIELQSKNGGTVLKTLISVGCIVPEHGRLAVVGKSSEDVQGLLQELRYKTPSAPLKPKPKAKSKPKPKPIQVEMPKEGIPVLMPQAGQTMETGTILHWKVKIGDHVEMGQPVVEIETDKANVEVESPSSGCITQILAQEGDTVAIQTPIAILGKEHGGGQVAVPTDTVTPILMPQAGQTMESGIILGWKVKEGDRIKTGQIILEIETDKANMAVAAEQAGRLAKIVAQEGDSINVKTPIAYLAEKDADVDAYMAATDQVSSLKQTGTNTMSLSKMRQAIAKNLQWSKQNIPHFYAKRKVNAEALLTLYQKTKAKLPCTINDFIVRASALALREYPALRCQLREGQLVEFSQVHIGVAVNTDKGLLVPVVLDADLPSFKDLTKQVHTVVDNARAGKLEGVGQGIFTISNMGMYEVEEFHAIVNPPESAILGVGVIHEDVKIQDGDIQATQCMNLTISVDHRLIDGTIAVQFLNHLKTLLESPELLV